MMDRTPKEIIDALAFAATNGAGGFMLGDNEAARLAVDWRDKADEIERLRSALRFYADPRGNGAEEVPDFYDELDFGSRAHEVLNPPSDKRTKEQGHE